MKATLNENYLIELNKHSKNLLDLKNKKIILLI